MSEERTSGGKEFMITLLCAGALYLSCGIMMSFFGSYAFIGGILSVLIFGVYGFYVLTRYTARFTYSLKNGRLRVNRMIGKRNKEVDIPVSCITGTAFGVKPATFPRKPYMMRVSIISNKKSMFIEFKDKDGQLKGLVIEPSQKLIKRIELERKKVDND